MRNSDMPYIKLTEPDRKSSDEQEEELSAVGIAFTKFEDSSGPWTAMIAGKIFKAPTIEELVKKLADNGIYIT
jgi:hypothetical protein